MQRITRRQHPLVARCRAVARGDDRSTILLDGIHLVAEALTAPVRLRHVIVTSEAAARSEIHEILARTTSDTEVSVVSPSVMAAVSPVREPSGIVGLADRPATPVAEVYARPSPFVLIACDVQDPGNIGAMARVAEAAGASGMIASGISADPFGWKALRGSMGSTLRLPIATVATAAEALLDAGRSGCLIAAMVPRGGTPFTDADLTGAVAAVVGGEGPGLAMEVVDRADVRITVPMAPPVESLNTAVAAALILYEAWRQRNGRRSKV